MCCFVQYRAVFRVLSFSKPRPILVFRDEIKARIKQDRMRNVLSRVLRETNVIFGPPGSNGFLLVEVRSKEGKYQLMSDSSLNLLAQRKKQHG